MVQTVWSQQQIDPSRLTMSLTIDLSDLRAHLAWRRALNHANLRDIKWTDGGYPVVATADEIEDWRFTGTNNIDFAEMILMEKAPPA